MAITAPATNSDRRSPIGPVESGSLPTFRASHEKDQTFAEGAIPYDVPGVELGHVDGRCSFESILHKYGLGNGPALVELAKIVHAADVDSDIDTSPEGRGLQAIAKGFSLLHGRDDHRKIALESPMYDALYALCLERAKRKAA